MMKATFGFWAMVGSVVLRAWGLAPAVIAREPGAAAPAVAAVVVFLLYVVCTVVTSKRVQAADPARAASLVWLQGAAGLALPLTLMWLI